MKTVTYKVERDVDRVVLDIVGKRARKKGPKKGVRYFEDVGGLWAMPSEGNGDYYSSGEYCEKSSYTISELVEDAAFTELTFAEADKLVKEWKR